MSRAAVVRPDWPGETACRWGAEQLRIKSMQYIETEGWAVDDLYANDAIKSKIIAALGTADFGSLLGHGNDGIYTAQMQMEVFRVGDQATIDFCQQNTDKGLNFLSCRVGRRLAPWMCEQGLKFAKAHTEDWVFVMDPNHWPDSIASEFFLPYCTFDMWYARTQDEDLAFEKELEKHEEVIDRSDMQTKPYKIQNYNSAELFKAGQPPTPPPPPQCPYSAAVMKIPIIGPPLVAAWRRMRRALIGR